MDRSNSVSPPPKKHNNSDSSSSRDRVLECLYVRVSYWDGDSERFDWCILNLEDGTITTISETMPPKPRQGSTAVACSNQIYDLGGLCLKGQTCPDGSERHLHNNVFYFDRNCPDEGWRTGPPMSVKRAMPYAVALDSKIYVFGGTTEGLFAEYFDINQNIWAPLPPPPPALNMDPFSISDPIVLDSRRSRLLVHFESNESLYAYYVDDKRWRLLKEDFGLWTNSPSVIVDDVLYTLESFDFAYSFSARFDECALRAYDLVEDKPLRTKWLSPFQGRVHYSADLFHIGSGNLCLVWPDYEGLEFTKFSVSKNCGEVHAIGDSESATHVPMKSAACEFFLP
ncbi:Kelch-type beta propeller [Corchorus olitorius]|uniref:Kelch-type beta propeller n=1 Tax=Corchorus olitorius TaxID=93759 RepID=A0A1R3KS35_9ROSI|nr:Kelch-type beta propeller [Corchorus olitorius]